jgi:RNA polymerase sigma factor (sigma-70 family)
MLKMAEVIAMQQPVFAEGKFEFPNKINLRLLYETHARELWAFAQRRVGRDEAEDVVHDTYLRVLQYGDKVELENPRAYLYRVAANVATDRGMALKACNDRTESEFDLDALDSHAPGAETIVGARRSLQRCLAALDELPDVYRHVFLLHRIDGLTQSEIACALDIPKRTVERYVAKALEHCLQRLAPELV